MKKLLGICICLLMICSAIVPAAVFAADGTVNSDTAEDIIHFLNPTAITTIDGYLFIADRIEENRSAIIYFDVTGDSPVYIDTIMLDEVVTNISSDNVTSKLYVITDSQVLEKDWTDKRELVDNTSYRLADYLPIDFAHVSSATSYTEYYLTNNYLRRFGKDITHTNATDKFDRGIACYASDSYVYYIYVLEGVTLCKRYNTVTFSTENTDNFNTGLKLPQMSPLGFFDWENDITVFDSKKIVSVAVPSTVGSNCTTNNILTYDGTNEILDVTSTSEKMFVLNNSNVVEIYKKNSSEALELIATIGSDTLMQNVPTVFTSFTLVKCKSYPSNIVFKTNGKNSVEALEIIKDMENTTFIVLGYEGDSASKYYYVLLGNRFGWVKKSDNAESVDADDRLQVINTNVNNGGLTYKAVSLNAVYVSPLPRQFFYDSVEYREVYAQEKNKKITVTEVLQCFTEGNTNWYYITFKYDGATHSGFVRDTDIKLTISSSVGESSPDVVEYKVNSLLFSTVKVYNNGEPTTMTEDNYAYNSDGKPIKLSSGSRVLVISIDREKGVAFVQIDKTKDFGYIHVDRLIGVHQITTNATVGLILLAIAITLGTALTVVFLRRRNGNKAPAAPATKEE